MKRFTLVLIVFSFVCTPVAAAPFVDVISQEYGIWGSGSGYNSQPYYPTHYDIRGPNPLHYDTGLIITGDNISGSGGYQIETSASGGFCEIKAWLDVYVETHDEGEAISFGSAYASMVFQPLLDTLVLYAYGDLTGLGGYVSLFDLTLNTLVLGGNHTTWSDPYYILRLDTNHFYKLTTQTEQINFDRRHHSLRITPVPEPSTIIFLGIALCLLIGGRKKFYYTPTP